LFILHQGINKGIYSFTMIPVLL